MLPARGNLNALMVVGGLLSFGLVAFYVMKLSPNRAGPQVSLSCPECPELPEIPECPACNCKIQLSGGSGGSAAKCSSSGSSGYAPPCRVDCGEHGQCFLGKCFCFPGYGGVACDKETHSIPACKPKNDACYEHETNGRMVVPMSRWDMAHGAESNLWASLGWNDDRTGDHIRGFKQYKDVPVELGDVIEVGCGPFTQIRGLLSTRSDVKVTSLTLEDPGLIDYMQRTAGCAYKTGKLRKYGQNGDGAAVHDFPLILVNAGGEQLSHMALYDTLLVANVVEHVWNGYDLWQNIYNAIRPGGILIFHDKYFNDIPNDYWHDEDSIYHPVRPFKAVIDHFLSKFDPLGQYHNELSGVVDGSTWHKQGYYFVGRKPMAFKDD